MDLRTALGVQAGELIAFVGAGGKTTTAWRLLQLLAASGERVVFTTTTRIFQPEEIPLILSPDPDPGKIARQLEESPTLVLATARGGKGDPTHAAGSPYAASPVKLVGLEPGALSSLARRLPGVTWLVEADGAKGLLLKAPADHEPVMPTDADRVIVVASLESIGRPLDERTVHRPEIAARLLGAPLGETLTPDLVASLVGHPSGGLKGIPPQAEVVALLTQWEREDGPHPDAASVAGQLMANARISRVILANLRAPDPVLEVWRAKGRRIADSLIR